MCIEYHLEGWKSVHSFDFFWSLNLLYVHVFVVTFSPLGGAYSVAFSLNQLKTTHMHWLDNSSVID